MTDHLLRAHAPIPDAGWEQLDDEAKERLTPLLGARRLVDFAGPHGWSHGAINLGHTIAATLDVPDTKPDTLRTRLRRVLPLGEIRVGFTVARDGVEDAARGAVDVDYDDLDRAAHDAAVTENRIVFHGWAEASITGVIGQSPHERMTLGTGTARYPHAVASAVDVLRRAGIEGPYALAVGSEGYTTIAETTEGGYLLATHLKKILGGDIVWTPGLDGAVVLTQRGGDFLFDVGQDLSIGYRSHDADTLWLYLEESIAFRVAEPDAAVALSM